ncbi:DNA topoisomerase (ATP-hydrolyzing) [Alkaliphilus metalliredigens QYMF]|uniref:DNA topoisomerase (ATP-hydrolyzing) n=1 Tax=Alkaliphilus metalliredigens (strain QYMF) TaxID=293826 RepID=A6TSS8_ALKMQ|nr:DNA topoisomerase (ATP-hydrolyzing) subunit A [Alkaliphilus metalliredigens]ABR49246.1 DNA topoisomerase (ATP-hydrolyzing) [Alkaliphilus metalliredigens QYMF]
MDKSINEIEVQEIEDTLESNYMPYAMSVIVSRALPEIDGFKPSHRKLLYTMSQMGLLTKGRSKSANIVGTTMKLNPHGDQAIYETMVKMTRGHQGLLHAYVDSKGNFGKVYSRDMREASARYTEAKLEKFTQEIFSNIDKNVVDFVDNYDSTTKEPTLLPTTFPNILVKYNKGIAVGMAEHIPSFNLKEVCEATIAYLKDKEIDLLEYLKAPDFSTGGELIFNEVTMKQVYHTGRGTFKVRGKYRYVKADNAIEIYEIPYTTSIEAIIESIIELVKKGKIKEITDIRDETDKNGLKITIDLKRGVNPDDLMVKFFKWTKLEDSFGCNFNILINGHPKVMGVKEILDHWIAFRLSCLKRQVQFEIDKLEEKLNLLKGLEKIQLNIHEVVDVIQNTKKDKDVIANLMEQFDLNLAQAEYIAEIKLRSLNQELILKKIKEISAIEKELKRLGMVLARESKQNEIIVNDLKRISEAYGIPRKTDIINENEVEVLSEEILIENYNMKLFLTNEGYIKKISLASLRSSGDHKLKDNDYIVQEIDGTNRGEVLLFSNKETVYKIKAYELEDSKASNLGQYLNNVLGLSSDEIILHIVCTEDYQGHMLFFFENGKGAKIPITSYETKTNRKQLANAYSGDSPLVYISSIEEDLEMMATSNLNKTLIFNTEEMSPINSRNSKGVQVFKCKKGISLKKIKPMDEVSPDEMLNQKVLDENPRVKFFLTKGGYIKKIPLTTLVEDEEQRLKKDDYIIQEVEGAEEGELLLFSNKQILYKTKARELEEDEDKVASIGQRIRSILALDADEDIIYITYTDNYKGHMLFFFENGKGAKIPLESYETKTNRKQLANAYNGESPLVYISNIQEDIELVATSNINKILIFNTAQINPKSSRDSKGVQILKSKEGSYLQEIKALDEFDYEDFQYYRGNIPAVGTFHKIS